jgi:hypothetical protein
LAFWLIQAGHRWRGRRLPPGRQPGRATRRKGAPWFLFFFAPLNPDRNGELAVFLHVGDDGLERSFAYHGLIQAKRLGYAGHARLEFLRAPEGKSGLFGHLSLVFTPLLRPISAEGHKKVTKSEKKVLTVRTNIFNVPTNGNQKSSREGLSGYAEARQGDQKNIRRRH